MERATKWDVVSIADSQLTWERMYFYCRVWLAAFLCVCIELTCNLNSSLLMYSFIFSIAYAPAPISKTSRHEGCTMVQETYLLHVKSAMYCIF